MTIRPSVFGIITRKRFPLDRIGLQATAACGVRRLSREHTKPCINLRETGGGTTKDIGFSAGLIDNSAIDAFVAANDGTVATWYDQSGNANDFTQATTAKQIKVSAAGVRFTENGKTCLNATVNTQFLIATIAGIAQPYSCIAIVNPSSWANNSQLIGSSSNNCGAIFDNGGTLSLYSGTPAGSSSTTLTGLMVLSAVFNGASSKLWQNGSLVLNNANPGSTIPGGFCINAGFTGASAGIVGNWLEFYFFNRLLDDAEFRTLEQDAAAFWNIKL